MYLEQNLAAQDNVLRALTEANVQYAAVRRVLSDLDQKSVSGPGPASWSQAAAAHLPLSARQVELHAAEPCGLL